MILLLACAGADTDAPYTERRLLNEIAAQGDWIELFGTDDADLTGWTLTVTGDDGVPEAWTLAGHVATGELLLLTADDLEPGFHLDANGATVRLLDGDVLVDEARYPIAFPGESWARVPDGGPYWETALAQTPGESNGEVR
jgi:hypothetical protein